MVKKFRSQSERLRAKLVQQGYKLFEKATAARSESKDPSFQEINNLDMAFWNMLEAVRKPEEKSPESDRMKDEIASRMLRLSKKQVHVINMIYYSGKSKTRVARLMGISRPTLYKVLKEALEIMRE